MLFSQTFGQPREPAGDLLQTLEGLGKENRAGPAMNNFGDGIRERKAPGIEIRGSRPGKKSCPGSLVCRQAVSRKVPPPRGFEQVGRKPLNVTPLGAVFYIFHEHGGVLHSWSSFAITALIVRTSCRAARAPVLPNSARSKVSADKLWGAPTLAWKTTSIAFGQRICVVVRS